LELAEVLISEESVEVERASKVGSKKDVSAVEEGSKVVSKVVAEVKPANKQRKNKKKSKQKKYKYK
jgi:hypothetical protein